MTETKPKKPKTFSVPMTEEQANRVDAALRLLILHCSSMGDEIGIAYYQELRKPFIKAVKGH